MKTRFNFKSQVCTDKNQSERLLALGLKKETADMVHYFSQSLAQDWTIVPLTEIETAKNIEGVEIPAWSLHRLMEMAFNSLNDADAEDEIYFIRQKNPFESMLELFEWLIKEGYFNKEYLVNQDKIDEHCKGVLEYLDYIGEEE